MKYRFLIFLFISVAFPVLGQGNLILERGVVSYISSQNVYVKFESTENISIGDTLFVDRGEDRIPFLVVNSKSSISCVGTPITSEKINVADELIIKKIALKIPERAHVGRLQFQKSIRPINNLPSQTNPSFLRTDRSFGNTQVKEDESQLAKKETLDKSAFKERIRGRVSVGSYSNLSLARNTHRMRYTFSLKGDHLRNSRISIDNYITFRHTIGEWDEVKNNLSSALKVYTLALKYDFSKTMQLTVGRKINPKISSMGAVDGIQMEKALGNFRLGAIVGSRPDYTDYGLNLNLFQFGGYIHHSSTNKNKYQQTTLAFIDQRNNSEIDRRFLYFQHNSSLIKNLSLFTSFEIALFEKVNLESKNTFNPTNLFASLRYRVSRRLNLSASYDTRKNLVYYETYKSFIDKLIEEESRQGIRFHVNYRPFKKVTWGINTGWRFQKSDLNLSKNLNSYLTISQIASTNVRATITASFLQTNYLDSKIFGIRISQELIRGVLTGDLNYRMVNYRYTNAETVIHQNIGGVNLSIRVAKKLTFYVYYEGTFDQQNQTYHRFNTRIIRRF